MYESRSECISRLCLMHLVKRHPSFRLALMRVPICPEMKTSASCQAGHARFMDLIFESKMDKESIQKGIENKLNVILGLTVHVKPPKESSHHKSLGQRVTIAMKPNLP
uniref:Ovule protein n=1 Tax=Panagrellus redivivus TaxID=6233 RepID=A0A7E4W5Y2_PANRE